MDVNAWPRKKTRQADALGKGPAHGVVLDSAADVKAGSGLALRPTRAAAAPCSDARNDGPRTGPPRHARLAQPRAAEDATGVDGGGVASIVSSDKRPRDAAHAADLPAADDSRRMRRALAASQAAHVADRALPPSAAGASTAASVMQTKTTRAEADDLVRRTSRRRPAAWRSFASLPASSLVLSPASLLLSLQLSLALALALNAFRACAPTRAHSCPRT